MTWGVIIDVPAPIEWYDAVHAEVLRRAGTAIDGLLVHVCRPADGGFQILEVWQDAGQFDRYAGGVLAQVMTELSTGPAPTGTQTAREFEVRGLVLPGGGVFR